MVERLLTTLDHLLYELILLIVLIPKTLVKAIVSPGWIFPYVKDQLDLPPEEQFQSYATPILFFVIVGTLPALLLLPAVGEPYLHAWALKTFFTLGLDSKVLCIAIFSASWPLAASLVLQILSRKEISRRTLRPVFYSQAYCFGAAYFFSYLSIPFFVVEEGGFPQAPREWWKFLLALPVLYLSWFAYSELRIVRTYLGTSIGRSLGILVLMFFAGLVLMLLIEAILLIGLATLEGSASP